MLVVSLHDVSPHTFDVSRKICDELERSGVTAISLLVVPDHHHRGHFLAYPEFLQWLRAMTARGHEAIIHGYYHQRETATAEDLRTRLITRFYTAGEGEFHDITASEATRLLTCAKREFAQAGLTPTGFIAPAWLLGSEARQVLCEFGFQYTTRLRDIVDLQADRSILSQSLVWSTRAAWRRVCSLRWNSLLFRRLSHQPLLRIGIHPPELTFPAVWTQILTLTSKALQHRTPITYHDCVQRLRGERRPRDSTSD